MKLIHVGARESFTDHDGRTGWVQGEVYEDGDEEVIVQQMKYDDETVSRQTTWRHPKPEPFVETPEWLATREAMRRAFCGDQGKD